MDREERITQLVLHMFTHQMAERIVDLEDENDKLLSALMSAKNELTHQELDPSRLESALRMYVAELDYDTHKYIESPEDGGPDRYPEEAGFFIRCWETAGGKV
jgi:hypothetical protein